ncbi:MAG TPA: MFS transporter, partial [Mycobacteriales bacterium]|nr:MFS transporter [Mycobacteriales bacterium]
YAGLAIGPLVAVPLGGARHPVAVWFVALALPLVAAAAVRRSRLPVVERAGERGTGVVWRQTLRPGVGLLLVNIGYVAVLAFGAAATTAHHLGLATYVIPIFAGGVIASRTILGTVPDRAGARRTLVGAAVVEAAGLVVFAAATSTALAVAALLALSLGQGLAVPSLGALALEGVPAERRGSAAGAFFAYFDAGVGLGGPFTGALAHAFDASVALWVAAAAVSLAPLVARVSRRERG